MWIWCGSSVETSRPSTRIEPERARFSPARDRAGNAVPDRVSSRVRWVLPVEPEPGEAPAARIAAPLTAPPSLARPASARHPLAYYINSGDYPYEAQRRGQHGIVRYEMTIGTDGIPTSCRVIGSSGSPSLDEATCRVMRTRARFRPARDAAGNPAEDVIRHYVTWVLP